MKTIFLTILLLCFTVQTFAQEHSYPKKIVNGTEYYEYTIEAGDGLYSISKKFGVSQSDLHNVNNGLTTNIKAGQIILIPIKQDVKIKENTNTIERKIHIVEPKQTLYAISKMYGVKIDSIIAINPGSENGIQIGQELLIPQPKGNIEKPKEVVKNVPIIKHLVKRKETLYSISRRYDIAIHDLISDNPELENGLKAGATIKIIKDRNNIKKIKNNSTVQENKVNVIKDIKVGKEDKAETEIIPTDTIKRNDTIQSLIRDSIIDTTSIKMDTIDRKLSIVYLLPIVSKNKNEDKNFQRFVEFYRGSLLALNEAKKNGLSANIYTYSTGKSTEKVIDLLKQLDSIDIDIIIGPAYSNQIDTVISYARQRNIISIIPFSSKIAPQYYYPKLMQFNPPQEELFTTILENTFAPKKRNYVIGRFGHNNNKGNLFANELCKILSLNGVYYKEVNVTPQNVTSIAKELPQDSTLFMLASTSITDVAIVLDSLHNCHLPKTTVWGFEEWGANLIKKFPNTVYYSLFNPKPTGEYIEEYQKWFGAYKQSGSVKYDLIGYDITSLLMTNIIMGNKDLSFEMDPYTQYMQSHPNFKFIDNRWVNTNYYLFKWDNITIKTIER